MYVVHRPCWLVYSHISLCFLDIDIYFQDMDLCKVWCSRFLLCVILNCFVASPAQEHITGMAHSFLPASFALNVHLLSMKATSGGQIINLFRTSLLLSEATVLNTKI